MTRAFWILLKRELGAYFWAPSSHVVFTLFSLLMAFSFWLSVVTMAQGMLNATVMQVFFVNVVFWFCLLTMIPLFTMRLFAEEYKSGTIELLMSAPVLEWDVILSKFFAAWIFFILMWLPTLCYLFAYQMLTHYQAPVEWGTLILSYLLVFVIGGFFIAIGLFTSSLTRNQVLAAFFSYVIILLLFVIGLFGFLSSTAGTGLAQVFEFIGTYRHLFLFANGIFDSRPVVYYLSGTCLFLFMTYMVVVWRKLRS